MTWTRCRMRSDQFGCCNLQFGLPQGGAKQIGAVTQTGHLGKDRVGTPEVAMGIIRQAESFCGTGLEAFLKGS